LYCHWLCRSTSIPVIEDQWDVSRIGRTTYSSLCKSIKLSIGYRKQKGKNESGRQHDVNLERNVEYVKNTTASDAADRNRMTDERDRKNNFDLIGDIYAGTLTPVLTKHNFHPPNRLSFGWA
jgi:hypothetical protein